jgi:hypothetical protein
MAMCLVTLKCHNITGLIALQFWLTLSARRPLNFNIPRAGVF